MKTLVRVLISLFLVPLSCLGASHYVDSAASAGNDGTSWTDAWTELDQITWASVAAGDIVYLSGGSSSKVYTTVMSVTKAGGDGNPITIAHSQDSSHDGLIIISNQLNTASAGITNIVFDFGKDPSYSTNIAVTDLWGITNNIGAVIRSTNMPVGIGSGVNDVAVSFASQSGNKLRWAEIGPIGMTNDVNPTAAVWFDSTSPYELYDVEVAYCYIHNMTGDGIHTETVPDDYPLGRMQVHHNIILQLGDDGLEVSGSIDIHHNMIGGLMDELWVAPTTFGHPDTIACPGLNFRIYNNMLYATFTAGILRLVPLYEWTGDAGYNGFVYGNVICNWWTTNLPMVVNNPRNDNWQGTAADMVYTNIVYLNNTVARSEANQPGIAFGRFVVPTAVYDAGGSANRLTIASNAFFLNNVFWNVNVGGGGSSGTLNIMTPATVDYNTFDSGSVDNIAVASVEPHPPSQDDPYTVYSSSAYNSTFGVGSNSVSALSIVSDTSLAWDWHLLSTDVGAKDIGVTPSTIMPSFLLDMMPDYDVDMDGNTRGGDGNWDRGAYEYTSDDVTNGLVLHFTFEDDFTGGVIADQSGNGNTGLRFGRYGTDTNWPVAIDVTNRLVESTGAEFHKYSDGYATYGTSGDYVGVTNLNLGDAANVSFSVWGKYYPVAAYGDAHQSQLICSGAYGIAGAWILGHENIWPNAYNTRYTKFEVFYGSANEDRVQCTFPDYHSDDDGTTNMNHYAVTFDDGLVEWYFNGVSVGSTNSGQSTLLMNTQTRWLALGAGPHHGAGTRGPYLYPPSNPLSDTDEYPNWRWIEGAMDNVRIYSRTLTDNEVATIYELESGEPADVTVERILNVSTLHVGTITSP